MRNEYPSEQKTSIEVGPEGVTLTGNQSDYLGTIIWVIAGVLIILALVLLRWGPEKFKALFKKNGSSSEKGDSLLNGKARLEDINKNVIGLRSEVSVIRKIGEENAVNLEAYKTEVEKKFSDKTTIDVEQREKIKALERAVYKNG